MTSLYARIDLHPDATTQDVNQARDAIAHFLTRAIDGRIDDPLCDHLAGAHLATITRTNHGAPTEPPRSDLPRVEMGSS